MEIIYLERSQAADLTTFKELIKFYRKKDPSKFGEAVKKNEDRYSFLLKEVLATKVEASEEDIAA